MKYEKNVETEDKLIDPCHDTPSVYYCKTTGRVEYFKGMCVDMGLPSGIMWARMNVGATKETEVGKYFAWGDTEGFYGNEPQERYIRFTSDWYSQRDASKVLIVSGETDAVTVNMGGDWRMPTSAETVELFSSAYTYSGLTVENGVSGVTYTSKNNGETIFFPCNQMLSGTTGVGSSPAVLWTSTLFDKPSEGNAYVAPIGNIVYVPGSAPRYYGMPIRGVKGINN